jgi:hypothetical protein
VSTKYKKGDIVRVVSETPFIELNNGDELCIVLLDFPREDNQEHIHVNRLDGGYDRVNGFPLIQSEIEIANFTKSPLWRLMNEV